MTLRTKATVYFCAGFVCIWTLISLLLFIRFKKTLLTGFDNGLRVKAALVAGKTSLQPRTVPLPENSDLFIISYRAARQADTLFQPPALPFALPSPSDTVFASNGWRLVRLQQPVESGGMLTVLYAASGDDVYGQVRQLTIFLWLVLLAGAGLSGIVAWYLSSRMLQPVQQVIRQANAINLHHNTTPLPLPDGEGEGRELVASINRMLARIQEQAERQTAFFAAASHELRTPLSVMQTRLQVLLQSVGENAVLAEAYRSQLEGIRKLARMVNDFLLMSQLQSGRTEMKALPVDLVELVTQLVESTVAKAAQRQNRFRLSFLPEEADFEIIADAEKTEIILNNLLSNAVKYAADDTIIHISVQQRSKQLSIEMTNSIRPDIHPKPVDIKNAFYQAKPLHGEGFGLGLWIANQLASLQNMDLYCSISKERIFTATLVANREISDW